MTSTFRHCSGKTIRKMFRPGARNWTGQDPAPFNLYCCLWVKEPIPHSSSAIPATGQWCGKWNSGSPTGHRTDPRFRSQPVLPETDTPEVRTTPSQLGEYRARIKCPLKRQKAQPHAAPLFSLRPAGLFGGGDGLLCTFNIVEQKYHRQCEAHCSDSPESDAPTRFLHVFVHKNPTYCCATPGPTDLKYGAIEARR